MAPLRFPLATPAGSAVPPSVAPAGRDELLMAPHEPLLAFKQGDVGFTAFCCLLARPAGICTGSRGQPEFRLHRPSEEQLEVDKAVRNVRALPKPSRVHDVQRL